MCNDKGLSSRRTFILSLSIHEGCTSLSTKRTPKPTNIYFKFIISLRLYRTIHERGLRSRQTFILSLSSHWDCTVQYMREDSGADEHILWVCWFMEAVPYNTWERTPEPTNIFYEFVDSWRLYRVYHEGGLSSRQTFILILSSHEGCNIGVKIKGHRSRITVWII